MLVLCTRPKLSIDLPKSNSLLKTFGWVLEFAVPFRITILLHRSIGDLMAQENISSTNLNFASALPQENSAMVPKNQIVILYKRHAQPDEYVLALLDRELQSMGHSVFFDRHVTIGAQWEREIEDRIRTADAVIPLLSPVSLTSAMLLRELKFTERAANARGNRPQIFPVRIGLEEALPNYLGTMLNHLQYAFWSGPGDDATLAHQLLESITKLIGTSSGQVPLEQVGGAVPLKAKFYIERQTDEPFLDAINRRDSIVLIKGAQQMGKSSLLMRGLQAARNAGGTVFFTDFQCMNKEDFESPERLYLAIAETMADRLNLDVLPQEVWKPQTNASHNFQRYLRRHVLTDSRSQFVWGLDEVDRLITCSFGSEVLNFFRSLHNERALSPDGPWGKFTMALSCAIEPHLFIANQNQSPFNIGTVCELTDFTLEQVAELNRRHRLPLKDEMEISSFYRMLGGHPFLVRRGMHEMVRCNLNLASFHRIAYLDEGPFGDHMRRFLVLLSQDSTLNEIARDLLNGQRCRSVNGFYRLKSAGLLTGGSKRDARIRCQLYENYLRQHL